MTGAIAPPALGLGADAIGGIGTLSAELVGEQRRPAFEAGPDRACPSAGRGRRRQRRGRPAAARERIVGSAASTRVASVTTPARRGTLKLTRMKTRQSRRSTWSMSRIARRCRRSERCRIMVVTSTMRFENPATRCRTTRQQLLTKLPSTTWSARSTVDETGSRWEIDRHQLFVRTGENALQRTRRALRRASLDLLLGGRLLQLGHRSTIETLEVGTRMAYAVELPFNSGSTRRRRTRSARIGCWDHRRYPRCTARRRLGPVRQIRICWSFSVHEPSPPDPRDAKVLVHAPWRRGQTVGGAGGVGDHVVLRRLWLCGLTP